MKERPIAVETGSARPSASSPRSSPSVSGRGGGSRRASRGCGSGGAAPRRCGCSRPSPDRRPLVVGLDLVDLEAVALGQVGVEDDPLQDPEVVDREHAIARVRASPSPLSHWTAQTVGRTGARPRRGRAGTGWRPASAGARPGGAGPVEGGGGAVASRPPTTTAAGRASASSTSISARAPSAAGIRSTPRWGTCA